MTRQICSHIVAQQCVVHCCKGGHSKSTGNGKIDSSASKGVCTNRREAQKLGCVSAPPPCGRGVPDCLEIRPFPICVILPDLVVLRQMV